MDVLRDVGVGEIEKINDQPLETVIVPSHSNSNRKLVFLLIWLVMGAVVLAGIGWYFIWRKADVSKKEKLSQVIPTIIPGKLYRNAYWGFELRYPDSWKVMESKLGDTVYLSSALEYLGNLNALPTQDQILVTITIIPEDMGADFVRAVPETVVKREISSVGGEPANRVELIIPLSMGDGGVKRERKILKYVIRHEGFTYDVSAEPADSTKVKEFEHFVSSLRFITRSPQYLPRTDQLQAGISYYQDLRLGYTFEYPDFLLLDPPPEDRWGKFVAKPGLENTSGAAYVNTEILLINSLDVHESLGSFVKDFTRALSLVCDADGGGSSTYCPAEDIKWEPFESRYGVQGYRVKRKMIEERFYPRRKIKEINQTLFVFKLNAPDVRGVVFGPVLY